MTKSQVKAKIVEYIKVHNLRSRLINTHNKPMLEKEMDTFYFWYDVQAPYGVECSVFLFEECMEVRGYYSECIAKELQEHPHRISELYEVLNFINARIWFDGFYYPRAYITVDGLCDVAINTIIPYEHFEMAPIETMEYITCYYPEWLEKMQLLYAGLVLVCLTLRQRKRVTERIIDEIKGRMMEDIVLLETKFSKKNCEVFRLQFAIGEFDMVVFNPDEGTCEIYEIKHSKEVVPQQCKYLLDKQKCKDTEFRYGTITGKYVIYRGATTSLVQAGVETLEDVAYLNVEEYLKKL